MDDSKISKEYYCISCYCKGGIANFNRLEPEAEMETFNRSIGNYFFSREETELAIRKLKAWVQLEDKGFEFNGIGSDEHGMIYIKTNLHVTDFNVLENPGLEARLNLLFGGGE